MMALTLQQAVFGFEKVQNPSVTFHGSGWITATAVVVIAVVAVVVFVLEHWAFLGEEIESFGLDFGDDVGMRPRDVWRRPMSGRSWPNATAFESGCDLDDEALTYAQFDFCCVANHLDHITINAFVAGLSDQRLETCAHFARRQVAGRGYELDPQGH